MTWMIKASSIITLVFVFLVSGAADSTENPFHPTLASDGWEEITFDGKRPNLYTVCGLGCIQINTNSSVSMLGKSVKVNLDRHQILNWEWKIGKMVAPSDLSVKGKDDRAIAVYVTFPYNPDTATFFERLMRPLLEVWRGTDTPSRGISYVWAASGSHGEIIKSPYFGEANVMIVTRNALDAVNNWVMERVDIVADHERAFGFSPSVVAHMLISADSDDTGTENQAYIKGLRFTKD
jgi:hypothetical protein